MTVPTIFIDENNADVKIYHEKWERSNKLHFSFMLQYVPKDIRGLVALDTLTIV